MYAKETEENERKAELERREKEKNLEDVGLLTEDGDTETQVDSENTTINNKEKSDEAKENEPLEVKPR